MDLYQQYQKGLITYGQYQEFKEQRVAEAIERARIEFFKLQGEILGGCAPCGE